MTLGSANAAENISGSCDLGSHELLFAYHGCGPFAVFLILTTSLAALISQDRSIPAFCFQ